MDTVVLRDRPADERPYERCFKSGPEALTDTELLAVLLRTGTKDQDVMSLSAAILSGPYERHGLGCLLHMTYEELTMIRGIGKVRAIQLICLGELVRRIWKQDAAAGTPSFRDPAGCAAYYAQDMRFLEREELRVAFLDGRYRLIRDMVMTRGTVDSSPVSVREILIEALRHLAVSVLLVHNHPGGTPEPSPDDIRVTKAVSSGLKAVGMHLTDHVIIAGRDYYSFRENGLLDNGRII